LQTGFEAWNWDSETQQLQDLRFPVPWQKQLLGATVVRLANWKPVLAERQLQDCWVELPWHWQD